MQNHRDITQMPGSGFLPETIVSPVDGAEMVLVPEGEFTIAYAAWAGKKLPTEMQWEKAGRGTDGRWWAWGNEFVPDRCNSWEYQLQGTSEIGTFDGGISPYGCYDMCGNVWEMCTGQWLEGTLPMRGGCFLGSATFVRVTCRWTPEDPDNGAHWLGFRCVKKIPVTSQQPRQDR